MPLPIILGIAAGIAGATGVGSGVHGVVKMKNANEKMKSTTTRHNANLSGFKRQEEITSRIMDTLGKTELQILESFSRFSDIIEKIHNRPQFKKFDLNGVKLPNYTSEELKQVSIGAGVLLSGMSGATLGTAGGFAAAGATTAAVMALGSASTGTAIASLSGVAATNATLAAIGGGAIATGGGGIALGTTILSAATLGVGLLVGGVIFSITGSSLSSKADEAWTQMMQAENEISKITSYLKDLREVASKFEKSISNVGNVYFRYLRDAERFVNKEGKDKWSNLSTNEKLSIENLTLLVNLLYHMCKVKVVLSSGNSTEHNAINRLDLNKSMHDAGIMIQSII